MSSCAWCATTNLCHEAHLSRLHAVPPTFGSHERHSICRLERYAESSSRILAAADLDARSAWPSSLPLLAPCMSVSPRLLLMLAALSCRCLQACSGSRSQAAQAAAPAADRCQSSRSRLKPCRSPANGSRRWTATSTRRSGRRSPAISSDATTAKARWSGRARCCSRSTRGRSSGRSRRPRRSSPRRRRSSAAPSATSQRDTPLAKERAIAQSQLDNDIQAKLAAQAAVKAAQAAVDTAQLNVELHEGPLAHRRRRRDRHGADRRSGRPDDAAHDGVAGRSDPRLLLAQRAGVSRASPSQINAAGPLARRSGRPAPG